MIEPRSHRHLVIRGGTLVTMDPERRVTGADLLIREGTIAAIGKDLDVPPATRRIDAAGLHVFPGFIQAHVHLGQSIFRGLAEDRELLSWLTDRIWPLEAAHTEESAYLSGMLGAMDAILSGTTTIQEIGLVRGMEGIFRSVLDSGLRAVAGKCLMDTGENVPPALLEKPEDALRESASLIQAWEGRGNGRITGALCPRFILSCSRDLWRGTVELAADRNLPVHTHLLESRGEEEAVRAATGRGQMEFMEEHGVLDTDLRIAHGVWLREKELSTLAGRELKVAHCPSANLKLGSGIADLVLLTDTPNLAVGIGTDGAPCNNDMDVLEEMRLAGLLQAQAAGPGRFGAERVLALATDEGARAVGLGDRIGSLEVGKAGDVVLLDLDRPQTFGAEPVSVYDRVVFAAGRDAVRTVIVDGEVLLDHGRFPHLDEKEILARCREEIKVLLERANLD